MALYVNDIYLTQTSTNVLYMKHLAFIVYNLKIILNGNKKIKIARLRPAAIAIYSIQCLEFIQLCIVFHA